MDYEKVLAEIFANLENDRLEKAVMGCLRVARGAKDFLSATIFMRELYPGKSEISRMLVDEMGHLNQEAQKFVWQTSFNRWLELHTLDYAIARGNDDEDDRTVFKIAVGEIDGELEQWERSISEMVVPSGMHAFDAAAFTDRFIREKAQIRLRIKALQVIKARVKARCFNYATQIERQLSLQHKSQGLLEAVQNEVNNYFKGRSDDVYNKLQKASELAMSMTSEDASLLLTQVRRALKAAADYFYPPNNVKVSCNDGSERVLGEEQYLNRLQEFLVTSVPRSAAKDLLRAELNYLVSFLRRLNEMASKGVHASVTSAEAMQGLIGLYFFLFNISRQLTAAAKNTKA